MNCNTTHYRANSSSVPGDPTPLYFLPISIAAWGLGRRAAAVTAVASVIMWGVSNRLAGMHYSTRPIWWINASMHLVSFMVVGQLIGSLRAALARELLRGRTDALTLLLNRRAFYEMAEQVMALGRRYRHPMTIAYIDLDNFKAVNDTRGHDEGDRVLQMAARALKASVRAGDLCARLGGDEFVVLLPETGGPGAEALLGRLRALLNQELRDASCAATVSIGAVTFDAAPADIETLVREADAAMYRAKAAGKDRLNIQVALQS